MAVTLAAAPNLARPRPALHARPAPHPQPSPAASQRHRDPVALVTAGELDSEPISATTPSATAWRHRGCSTCQRPGLVSALEIGFESATTSAQATSTDCQPR